MNVMCRRGISRFPMTIAANIAPTPPRARMNPRSRADPCMWFFTMKGSKTSDGPQKIR